MTGWAPGRNHHSADGGDETEATKNTRLHRALDPRIRARLLIRERRRLDIRVAVELTGMAPLTLKRSVIVVFIGVGVHLLR
jgi:hypothetical protein